MVCWSQENGHGVKIQNSDSLKNKNLPCALIFELEQTDSIDISDQRLRIPTAFNMTEDMSQEFASKVSKRIDMDILRIENSSHWLISDFDWYLVNSNTATVHGINGLGFKLF